MTTNDLAVVTHDQAALAELNRHAVVELLERGKSWLQQALQRDTEIGELVGYKGDAAVLRELVIQKELGKDAELSATELVRRAERAIGVAIRRGQAEGTVTSRDHPHQGPRRSYVRGGREVHVPGRIDDADSSSAVPPSEASGMSKDELARGVYPMADEVTEQQFDEALDEAKAEGNLSRANVVRKIKGRPLKSESKRPEALRKTRRLDAHKIVSGIVEHVANPVSKSLLDEVDFAELEEQDLREWISSLSESIGSLQGLRNRLKKELTHP